MLQNLNSGLRGNLLLAGGLEQLSLPQNIHTTDLSGAKAGLDQVQHILVGFNLFFDQFQLILCLDQLIPGADDLRRERQRCGLIIGKGGPFPIALCFDAGADASPQVDLVLRRESKLQPLGVVKLRAAEFPFEDRI